MKTVSDLGERKLIELASQIYREHQETVNLTDDCAIISLNDEYLLASTDMITEKTHIPDGMNPWQIGWFVTAINLSDIAAKGGHPLGILLSFGLPKLYPESSYRDLIKGVSSCATKYNTAIIGGDTKENRSLTISGTAIGIVKKDLFLSRKGAQPGDIIAVTGNLGKAAAGLYELTQLKKKDSINALCEPTPRIFEGAMLAETGKVHCCMDLSDGLSSSLYQLANLNNIGFQINYDLLPISPLLHTYAKQDSTVDESFLSLHFGGDYELLLITSKEDLPDLQDTIAGYHTPLTMIGEVIAEKNIYIIEKGHNKEILPNRGYEHLTDTS